jgi:hypothetical protein
MNEAIAFANELSPLFFMLLRNISDKICITSNSAYDEAYKIFPSGGLVKISITLWILKKSLYI